MASITNLRVPYWIDGLGSLWESALHSEAERTALAYCGVLTEGNRLSLQDIHDDVAKHLVERGIDGPGG